MAKTRSAIELYYSGAWHDITATDDVLTRDPITITRMARAPRVGSSSPPSSALSATLKNVSGKFSPRNPMSPLYKLIGRNTPIRVTMSGYDIVVDSFNRTLLNSWGVTEDTNLTWVQSGTAGTAATDYQATGGVVTHTMPSPLDFRHSTLSGFSVADITTSVRCTFNAVTITGGGIEPGGLVFRHSNDQNFYLPRIVVNTSGTVTAQIYRVLANVYTLLTSATVSGLAWTGQWLRVKAQVTGTTIRMKAWDDALSEPTAWTLSTTDANLTTGSVGIRSGVGAANTNTGRLWSYDEFTMDPAPRFFGEVASWPQDWTVDGKDVWATIDAAGIMLRLNASGTVVPVVSALRRAFAAGVLSAGLFAYWPLEGDVPTSGIAGGATMVQTGQVQYDSQSGMVASAALPDFSGGGSLAAPLPVGAVTNEWRLEFVARFGTGSDTIDDASFTVPVSVTSPNGTVNLWELLVSAGTAILQWSDTSGGFTGLLDSGKAVDDGLWHHFRIDVKQVGANITANLRVDGVLSGIGATLAGKTLNSTGSSVAINLYQEVATYVGSVGHIGWWAPYLSSVDTYVIASGHPGETALARMIRLCGQNGIAFNYLGAPSETALVGVQRVATTADLLFDAADADMGLLYEPRGFLGLTYRTRYNLYNQTPALTLNYVAGGEVAPPLKPVEDWDAVANDVTVTRYQGASARVVQATGTLNVQEPTADPDGVGRYPQEPILVLYQDTQALNHAGWLKHIGTWDEGRYPVVNADLTAMDVAAKTALIARTASLNVGSWFAINHPPAWLTFDDIIQLAQGFTEVIESHRWRIAANAVPALPYEVFVIGSGSGNRSRIPAGPTTTLAGTMTTTGTSRTVMSTATPWIDSAGYAAQFPFDIIVMGERMTVTAIAGTASPQTFTVVRSVNGVVKTHAAGEPVQLFRPAVIRL